MEHFSHAPEQVNTEAPGVAAEILSQTGPAVLLKIPAGKKGPVLRGWQKLSLRDMTPQYMEGLNHGGNVGVLLGKASDGLCSIDCDSDEFLTDFLAVNPELAGDTLVTRGARGGNIWVRIEGDFPKSSKLKNVDGKPWGEFRADGNQTVIHGTHPSGCKYQRNDRAVESIRFEQVQWPENVLLPWKESPAPSAAHSPEAVKEVRQYLDADSGRAAALIDRFESDVRYVPERNIWLTWTENSRWEVDRDGAMIRLALRMSSTLAVEASKITGTDKAAERQREDLLAAAGAWGKLQHITACLKLAQVDRRIILPAEKLDSDLWCVAAKNAVIELRTGTIRGYGRNDFTTHELGCEADADATCPRWETFVEEVFPDPHVRRYMHKCCGYTLTGATTEHAFWFLYGSGANGKSVFLATLEKIMGGYAVRCGKGVVAANSRGDAPKGEIAELAGARLACAPETAEGERMNEEIVKDLTGGDFLRGERKYEHGFRFKPQCKLWVAGNHKPSIRGTDGGIWRRVRLVPFLQTFEGSNADRDLAAKLAAEAPGILSWMVQGCLLWQAEGLEPPGAIRQAVADYRTEEDVLGDFLAAAVEEDAGQNTLHGDIFKRYQEFCEDTGTRYQWNSRKLAKSLKERGWRDGFDSRKQKLWRGVLLAHAG